MNPLSEYAKEGEYSSNISLSDTINSFITNEPAPEEEGNESCPLGGEIESDGKHCEIDVNDETKDTPDPFLKPEMKPVRNTGPRALRRRPGN